MPLSVNESMNPAEGEKLDLLAAERGTKSGL